MPHGKFSSINQKYYPDLGSASNWSCLMGNFLQLIRSTTQIWEVMCHQCGIFAFVSQMLVLWEISGDFSLKPSEQRYRFDTCYCLFHFSVEINIFCFFFLSSDLLLLNQFTIINLNKIILE